jgi:type IV pilus assembly protein PilQ
VLPYEGLPAPIPLEIPLQGQLPHSDGVQSNGQLITLSVRDAPLNTVLSMIAQQQGLSIVAGKGLTAPVSVTLQPMPLDEAMNALMAISGCTWTRSGNVIYVTEVTKESSESFLAQGRVLRVFPLNYLSALDAEKVVTGLLSPVGKAFSRQTDTKDKRRTAEQLIVEDLPAYVDRIASYLAQSDQPPQQVIVEVRMLQVKLQDNMRHGINFDALARLAGSELKFSTQSMASAVGQTSMITVDGTDFNSLLDCLATTNDTKTLASPKLLMLNGQESKIVVWATL